MSVSTATGATACLPQAAHAALPLTLHCPVVETARLLLRPPHIDDIEDMAHLANNYAVASMLATMPHPYFPADAREFIETTLAAKKAGCVYAITHAQTGAFMGTCGLHEDAARFELPFIGYWLGTPWWGKGYASEAARAMVSLFFKVTAGETLMISCRSNNSRSRRVIEKCGGTYWKSAEKFNEALGEMHQIDHFRVTRPDWMAQATG